MAVTLPADVCLQYRRFSLYNSPFVAHEHGHAIDLYPETESEEASPGTESEAAPSPVAGEVLDVRRVRTPPRSYAAEHDWLVLVDTADRVARILHVDPSVDPGDVVGVGDPLGDLVRAGFFAPWVPNHLHLEFRHPDADPYRASGSLPLSVDVDVRPLAWDGTGTVVETGGTWARLDAPAHPDPGEYFVGIEPEQSGGVLDGGLPHYDGGGLLDTDGDPAGSGGPVELAGHRVGTADGRDVSWDDVTVLANGEPITGVALFCAKDAFGAKLVGEDVDLNVGTDVHVTVAASGGAR